MHRDLRLFRGRFLGAFRVASGICLRLSYGPPQFFRQLLPVSSYLGV